MSLTVTVELLTRVYSLVAMVENKVTVKMTISTGGINSITQTGVLTGNVGDQSEGKKQLHHSSV